MNNIKPQWVVIGFIAVGALWQIETSNRPDAILDHSFQSDHLVTQEVRDISIPYEPVSSLPEDSLSVIDQQVAEKKITQPLTARMMVANRGEFFAIQSTALPAQEQALRVDLGQQQTPLNGASGKNQACEFNSCFGQDASDY